MQQSDDLVSLFSAIFFTINAIGTCASQSVLRQCGILWETHAIKPNRNHCKSFVKLAIILYLG